MLFYILRDKEGGIYPSPFPFLDKLYNGACSYLYPGCPLEFIKRYLQDINALMPSQNEILREISRGLKKEGSLFPGQVQWLEIDASSSYKEECQKVDLEKKLEASFLSMIEGRLITEGEFPSLAGALGIRAAELPVLLHLAVIKGYGEWRPGLTRTNNSWRCERCGDENCQRWPSYYGEAATCLGCKSIGPVTSLQVIFRSYGKERQGRKKKREEHTQPNQDWQFTPAQSVAAADLLLFINKLTVKEALVWAACGAGKTEITFPVIEQYLQEGKRVLYAAPRQDVVHDIQPRLQRYFNSYKVKIMSGLVQADWTACPLTVATTHQILKFYRAFDLIILDEMDAYPYADNRVLEAGINRAIKNSGKIIYLTATPSDSVLQKVRRWECYLTRLPARFHGYPLPVPEFLKIEPPRLDLGRITYSRSLLAIRDYLQELMFEGQLFVFVPTISMVGKWVEALSSLFKDKKITGSWSSDPERKNNVTNFISGNYDLIVCTSILERGITVPKAQVAVLYADHALYDVRTLVQMAGRVGRTAASPQGRVLFIAGRQSKAIKDAIRWIKDQNELAAQGGFLRDR